MQTDSPPDVVEETDPVARRPRITMRWKLLAAFAGAFTVVFAFIALFVVRDAGDKALARLQQELRDTAIGGAQSLDSAELERLTKTVPPIIDPSTASGTGYPDSPDYKHIAKQLMAIRQIVPQANPYTYFLDAKDNQLYFGVSAGYYYVPQFGVTFKEPVAMVANQETYQRMAAGLVNTTNEPPYTDDYGSWISAYSPILSKQGKIVGAIGIDYPLDYVTSVRTSVQRNLIIVLGISYATLLLLVVVLSSALVKPLARLTVATRRIADGEYDLDVSSLVRSRFPDEMYELGKSFATMAKKVAARERSLTREVQRLRVEIDQSKREEQVREITETDFFSDLTAKASQLRKTFHERDSS